MVRVIFTASLNRAQMIQIHSVTLMFSFSFLLFSSSRHSPGVSTHGEWELWSFRLAALGACPGLGLPSGRCSVWFRSGGAGYCLSSMLALLNCVRTVCELTPVRVVFVSLLILNEDFIHHVGWEQWFRRNGSSKPHWPTQAERCRKLRLHLELCL